MNIIHKNISNMTYRFNKLNKAHQLIVESQNTRTVLSGDSINLESKVLNDIIGKKAYATALLYYTESVKLDKAIDKVKLNEDIEELLHINTTLVEEQAPLLVKIKGYPIYEGEDYILRGDGKMKIKESFNKKVKLKEAYEKPEKMTKPALVELVKEQEEKISQLENDVDYYVDNEKQFEKQLDELRYEQGDKEDIKLGALDELLEYIRKHNNFREIYDDVADVVEEFTRYYMTEEAEGTQTSDIAGKIDYTDSSLKKKKYKPYVSSINESDNVNLKGFIRGVDGYYTRNNFVLVEEIGTKKVKAIRKSDLTK